MQTAQSWFIGGPRSGDQSVASSSSPSLLSDWNSYAASKSEDNNGSGALGFDIESAVRSANDKVSGTFSVDLPKKGETSGEKISKYIPKMTQKEMEDYLQDWSERNHRPITDESRYAVAKAIIGQSYIKESEIGYILLGWDLRGDHNIVEIKNALPAVKDAITSNIAGQKTFGKEFSSITTGLSEQINKLLKHISEPSKPKHVDVPKPVNFPILKTGQIPIKSSPEHCAPMVGSYMQQEPDVKGKNKKEETWEKFQEDSYEAISLRAKRLLKIAGMKVAELKEINTKHDPALVLIQVAAALKDKNLDVYESKPTGKQEVKKLLITSMLDSD